jgi:hypothetical protein
MVESEVWPSLGEGEKLGEASLLDKAIGSNTRWKAQVVYEPWDCKLLR